MVFVFPDLTTPPYDATDNQLIGTSKERSSLNNEINASYQISLQLDEDKEKEKITDEKIANCRIALMNERKKRAPDDPNFGVDIAVVKIRHPLLGTKARFFNGDSHENPHSFTQIYDWVGSLSQTPEHLYIVDYSGKRISPEKKVFSGIFNVEENGTPVLMSPEGIVAFRGYSTSRIVEKAFGDTEYESFNTDNSLCIEEVETDGLLENLRNREYDRLSQSVTTIEVSRENIYADMLNRFTKRNVLANQVVIHFADENAVGDGVSRDAFSAFFESLYGKMDGYFEKIPTSKIPEDELEIVCKIIHQGYIQYGMIPSRLSRSCFKYYLFETISDEELITSFFNFVTPLEAERIKNFTSNDTQSIMDILFEYSIFEIPTTENVMKLVLEETLTLKVLLQLMNV